VPALLQVSVKCALGSLCHKINEILEVRIPRAFAVHQSFLYKACCSKEFYENLLLDGPYCIRYQVLICSIDIEFKVESLFGLRLSFRLLVVIELFVRIFTA